MQGNRRRFGWRLFVELPHTQIANQGFDIFAYVNGLLRLGTMPDLQFGQLGLVLFIYVYGLLRLVRLPKMQNEQRDLVAFLWDLEEPHFNFMKPVAATGDGEWRKCGSLTSCRSGKTGGWGMSHSSMTRDCLALSTRRQCSSRGSDC